jgi:hypothetical protein
MVTLVYAVTLYLVILCNRIQQFLLKLRILFYARME